MLTSRGCRSYGKTQGSRHQASLPLTTIAWRGLEPGLVCASGELLFLGKDTVGVAGRLLYLECRWANTRWRVYPIFRPSSRGRQGLGAHFVHDLTAVHLDGDFAGAQFGGDLLVEPTGDDEPHHVPLTAGQCVIALAQRGQCSGALAVRRGLDQWLAQWPRAGPDRGRAWSGIPPLRLLWPAPSSGCRHGQ